MVFYFAYSKILWSKYWWESVRSPNRVPNSILIAIVESDGMISSAMTLCTGALVQLNFKYNLLCKAIGLGFHDLNVTCSKPQFTESHRQVTPFISFDQFWRVVEHFRDTKTTSILERRPCLRITIVKTYMPNQSQKHKP